VRSYQLVCPACGKSYNDDGYRLQCDDDHEEAILRTRYRSENFDVNDQVSGLARYASWLPINSALPRHAEKCAVFRSDALAREIGMENLWIAFSGYWPERGVRLETGTFKELEANVLMARLPLSSPPTVIGSVGNTAAALARAFSQANRPLIVVVPESGMKRLRFAGKIDRCVTIVGIQEGSYQDAIEFGKYLCERFGWVWAGGARNVATRDGLATVMLAAFEELGSLPEHYFQAVGSGAGAIAAWEASRRLQPNGHHIPMLTLCQNAEFAPILSEMSGRSPRQCNGQEYGTCYEAAYADELANPHPLVWVKGGLGEALADSNGNVRTASAGEAREAQRMFAELEGIDIESGPAVAVACLRAAISDSSISPASTVLLNITGGGRRRLERDRNNDWPLYFELVSLGESREVSADRIFEAHAKG
jgi:cysteate synthase